MSLDATVIDLCATMFDWARFRRTKGAVKLHLLLDHDGYLPTFAHITEGAVHEVNVARSLDLPTGSVIAIDKGYYDFRSFSTWTEKGIWFVTRLKKNANYHVVEEQPLPEVGHILSDELIRFAGLRSVRPEGEVHFKVILDQIQILGGVMDNPGVFFLDWNQSVDGFGERAEPGRRDPVFGHSGGGRSGLSSRPEIKQAGRGHSKINTAEKIDLGEIDHGGKFLEILVHNRAGDDQYGFVVGPAAVSVDGFDEPDDFGKGALSPSDAVVRFCRNAVQGYVQAIERRKKDFFSYFFRQSGVGVNFGGDAPLAGVIYQFKKMMINESDLENKKIRSAFFGSGIKFAGNKINIISRGDEKTFPPIRMKLRLK